MPAACSRRGRIRGSCCARAIWVARRSSRRWKRCGARQAIQTAAAGLSGEILRARRPASNLSTDSEAPAGAGISGSSTLIIAVASALNRLTGAGYHIEKLREIAQNIEAQIIRVPTGAQDYYPAMYGGVSAIELGAAGIVRKAIAVDLDDLNERIVLAYTGEPRNSGINNWEVTKAHIDGDREVCRNFDHIAAIAMAMRGRSEKADWKEMARLLREEWGNRRKNAPGISTPLIDRLIAVTRRAGAAGAKVCGAGGGGCVFFLVERGAKDACPQAIEAEGARCCRSGGPARRVGQKQRGIGRLCRLAAIRYAFICSRAIRLFLPACSWLPPDSWWGVGYLAGVTLGGFFAALGANWWRCASTKAGGCRTSAFPGIEQRRAILASGCCGGATSAALVLAPPC